MNAPACFQVILARSALYKKSAGQYGTTLERAELETAVVEHKTHAIHRIRQLSEMKDDTGSGGKDELIASIISLGTLEMRMGSTDSGDVHYSAVRRLLKSIGGPMNIQDLRLNRVMCFFECVYGTPRNSYIWDKEGFRGILKRFNEYLGEVYEIWKERDRGRDEASGEASSEHRTGYPSPSENTDSASETPVKKGKGSKRKPTDTHSPYFGLQPPPEAVPQPPPKAAPITQPSRRQFPDRSAPSRVPATAHDRILKATSSVQRPARADTRPPAKERARHTEKQKQKARAMDIDPQHSRKWSAFTQSHHATDSSRSRPQAQSQSQPPGASASDMLPPLPTSASTLTQSRNRLPSPNRFITTNPPPDWTLSPTSALHQRLTITSTLPPPLQEKSLIWDLACLLCLCSIVTSPQLSPQSLTTYITHLSHIISTANLHASENNSNMMWLIQTNDGSAEHSARMWDVAGWMWVCKHLNGRVRRRVREWVWGFLVGERLKGKEGLSGYDFSYAS